MLKNLLLVASIAWLATSASAQTAPPAQPSAATRISGADLQSDVAILRRTYEALHPGLYRYNTKPQMDAAFAALSQRFASGATLAETYLALSEFTTKIRCGHTYANFYNQKDEIQAAIFQGQNRVPFYFRWLDGRMIVVRDWSAEKALPRGTEVLAINGHPAAEIQRKLMTVTRADGSNDAKRIALLEVLGEDEWETFDIFFPMYFSATSPQITLQVQRPQQKSQQVTVTALTQPQRLANREILSTERAADGATGDRKDGVVFEFRTLPNGDAYLRMPDWALYNSKWDWKTWLNARMDELVTKHTPALIIDLRGNEGGLDVGDVILSRLLTNDLKVQDSLRLVRYRAVPPELRTNLDTWDKSFFDWGSDATPWVRPATVVRPWLSTEIPPVEYFTLKSEGSSDGSKVISAVKPRFTGRVVVLTDAQNSSATFQFENLIRKIGLGTLIGQPTGGNRRGINGGAFFFLRLPKSGLEVDLPLISNFPTTAEPDAGLEPDLLVKKTPEAIEKGIDLELQSAIKLLQHPASGAGK